MSVDKVKFVGVTPSPSDTTSKKSESSSVCAVCNLDQSGDLDSSDREEDNKKDKVGVSPNGFPVKCVSIFHCMRDPLESAMTCQILAGGCSTHLVDPKYCLYYNGRARYMMKTWAEKVLKFVTHLRSEAKSVYHCYRYSGIFDDL